MVGVRIGRRLLGRHVRRRAERHAERCQRRRCRCASLIALATPKSVTIACAPEDQHVVRLDVAMHDAALVRVRERVRDIARECARPRRSGARRRARAARAATRPPRTASCSRAGRPLRRPSAPARCADAAATPTSWISRRKRSMFTRRRHLGRQHLDHDLSAERVSSRDEHVRHPAAAELALDPVAARRVRIEADPSAPASRLPCVQPRHALLSRPSRSAAAPDPHSSTDRAASRRIAPRVCGSPFSSYSSPNRWYDSRQVLRVLIDAERSTEHSRISRVSCARSPAANS